MGFLTRSFVPRGGFLYTMIVPGEGFCSFEVVSRGFVPGGWFWMKLIPALPFVDIVLRSKDMMV